MGWTVVHFLKRFALTHSMTVEFKRPVYLGEEVQVEGKVIEVKGQREAIAEACLYKDGGDLLCARASAAFRLFTSEALIKLGIMDEESIQRFSFFGECEEGQE